MSSSNAIEHGLVLVPTDSYGLPIGRSIAVSDLEPTTIDGVVGSGLQPQVDAIIAQTLGREPTEKPTTRLHIFPGGQVATDIVGAISAATNYTSAADAARRIEIGGGTPHVVVSRRNVAHVFPSPDAFRVVPTAQQARRRPGI